MEDPTNPTRIEFEPGILLEHSGAIPFVLETALDHSCVSGFPRPNEEILYDEQGPIPIFPVSRAFDELGRLIPMSIEEQKARHDACRRSLKVINAMDQDPPGSDEVFLRGIDSHRPDDSRLFEGYY